MEIKKEHLEDEVIFEHMTQLKIINKQLESIRLEKSRLTVAKTVFTNSLAKYMKDNKL
jgi:ABC-type phosphate transport system auxiliary subunit|tara:strand:- start:705 stop:878 length:174 start_codon:yes stop_codon:yes gene_type:complete